MGYDITIGKTVTREVFEGDNYYITYNYSKYLYKAFGKNGIRTVYGMTGKESIPVIEAAMEKLGDDSTGIYWESTEGNAKEALYQMLIFAQKNPDGIWEGD